MRMRRVACSYHRQDVGLCAFEQVDCEDVARRDRVGLRSWELGPGWWGLPLRGVDSAFFRISHVGDIPCSRRRYLYSQTGQFAVVLR
jgi:hypothetical protein